jgi:hypothetical protein
MFHILSMIFPYKQIISDYALDPDQNLNRLPFVANALKLKGVTDCEGLIEHQSKPVGDMWDGFNRFCKTQELSGKLAEDLKAFELKTTAELADLEVAVKSRVIDSEHNDDLMRTEENGKEFATKKCDELEAKLTARMQNLDTELAKMQNQFSENKIFTMIKIDDVKSIAEHRVTEAQLNDAIATYAVKAQQGAR